MAAPRRLDRRSPGAPRQHLILGRLNWGGLLAGVVAGLGAAAAISVVLFAFGVRVGESAGGDAFFAAIQLAALVAAGYVGGRFSPGTASMQASHGALAGLLLFAVSAAIALAAGSDLSLLAALGGGTVALVLGSVGGTLSARR